MMGVQGTATPLSDALHASLTNDPSVDTRRWVERAQNKTSPVLRWVLWVDLRDGSTFRVLYDEEALRDFQNQLSKQGVKTRLVYEHL
jgi:predicted exporter